MKPKANYTRRKFGLLTVIDCVTPSDGHNKGGQWLCKCKCRRLITLTGYQLHSRNSCGCLGRKAAVERGKGNRKSDEEKSITLRYRKYRINNPNPVSKEKWILMMGYPCDYCKVKSDYIEIELIEGGRRDITICNTCRNMKRDFTDKDFRDHIKSIYLNITK